MKNNTTFAVTDTNLEMCLIIPKKCKLNLNPVTLEQVKQKAHATMLNIIKAFSPKLIASLERRMQACQTNLLNHISNVVYNDGKHIVYRRKDGTEGTFNRSSFQAMQRAVEALEEGEFEAYSNQVLFIDQTLKALLNDTEQDHSDSNGFKYSQLVSILCELQSYLKK